MAAAAQVRSLTGGLPWKLAAWALLISALYVPTILLRFDFNDDGCLVYPTASASLGQQLRHIWERSVREFHERGPFRPVCWAHWEAAANLLGPNALYRRAARLAWAALATGMLLWLLTELGFPLQAAVGAAALAMWNRFRNEIWLGLGLTEAFAMPYALLALIAALRASRGRRPWPWDALGLLCLLAALGIKNTFAAVVPVAVVLRLIGGGLSLREGWRRHRLAAGALGLTLLYPATHFLLFKLSPQELDYKTCLTWAQGPLMLRAVASAGNGEYLMLGLIVPLAGTWLARRQCGDAGTAPLVRRFRPALWAGALLVGLGIGIYLPINAVAGRYTLPAVWGLDILTALLLTAVPERAGVFWKRFAALGLAVWLVVVAVQSLGRQWKCYARNDLLWQALEFVETQAPHGAVIAWVGTDSVTPLPTELLFSEGTHFGWHLQARSRPDLAVWRVETRDAGVLLERGTAGTGPPLVVAGTAPPGADPHWQVVKVWRAPYWGTRQFECFVWQRQGVSAGGQLAASAGR
jgi:hypothetical protein